LYYELEPAKLRVTALICFIITIGECFQQNSPYEVLAWGLGNTFF